MPDEWNFSVHHGDGIPINHLCGERDKGSGRAPLVNPRGPARKSVLRTALTSRAPDCGRLDSPSWLGSPLSAIHGVQTLSFPLRFADFSGDTTPSLSYCRSKPHRCCCRRGFCRPDKAQPPSGNGAAEKMPDGASLIRPTRFQRLFVLHYSVYALFSPIIAV